MRLATRFRGNDNDGSGPVLLCWPISLGGLTLSVLSLLAAPYLPFQFGVLFALAGSGLSRPYGPSEPWLPMPLMIATFAVLLSGLVGLSIITFASLLVSWATVFKWLTVAGSLGILASFIVGYFRHRQAR